MLADQISIETAQSGLDLGVPRDLSDKTIILGVIDLSNHEVESAELVADRVRRAFDYTSPDRITIATDCGMKYLPRASAEGKMRAMASAASILRAELQPDRRSPTTSQPWSGGRGSSLSSLYSGRCRHGCGGGQEGSRSRGGSADGTRRGTTPIRLVL